MNDTAIMVSDTRRLRDALVSIDQYAFSDPKASGANQLRFLLTRYLAPGVQRLRVTGASALDLVWLAHGKLDACIIIGTNRGTQAPVCSSPAKPAPA